MKGFLEDDFSSDAEAARRLCPAALCRQVHGDNILYAGGPGVYEDCDGLYTDKKGLNLLIRTADCNAVALESPSAGVVMNLHVGWRGAAAGIVSKGIDIFRERAGAPRDIRAHIFPGARACCYEIREDVFSMLGNGLEDFVAPRGGCYYLDLRAYIERVLHEEGVAGVSSDPRCTICDAALFSYRRNGTKKRNCAFIRR